VTFSFTIIVNYRCVGLIHGQGKAWTKGRRSNRVSSVLIVPSLAQSSSLGCQCECGAISSTYQSHLSLALSKSWTTCSFWRFLVLNTNDRIGKDSPVTVKFIRPWPSDTTGAKNRLHRGHIGRLKVHPLNYFCIFYSFELKLSRMVEICIPKNRMFFVFWF